MAQTTSLVFNGGSIPSPAPAPTGSGKAKLLKIGEIAITEQGEQVTKKVICDPDSVTTVAPFMEVLTSAKLAELVDANSILVLDDGDMQYLMANANITVEGSISVCTAVNFLGLSQENKAKVAYNCTRVTDERTLQQVIEVGEPIETNYKIHRIGVRQVHESDTSPKPMTDWVIDLESPNPEEPDGYDRLTVARAKAIHNNGGVFAFTSYSTGGLANNMDIYYESIFNSSSSYLNIVLTKTSNHQHPAEISRAVIGDYGDYIGVIDASENSEYMNVTLVQEGSDPLKKNKIHRYSFGDGTVNGETPVYGYWLIDLDKPDPNGPEGYARVTPAEFWKSTAVNGEVPVYLQDKNANNSLTYAYLSRTDVTKSGGTVTSVFAYFVRSGYGNYLEESVGFRFTKLNGSDYLQRASQYDDWFDARSIPRLMMYTQSGQTIDHTVTAAESSAGVISVPLSHFNYGVYLLDVQLYVGNAAQLPGTHVPIYVNFRYKYSSGTDTWTLKHTGALAQIKASGPWYYGDTIRLLTTSNTLTGVDLEIAFGPNVLPENTSIGITISYVLLSETRPS